MFSLNVSLGFRMSAKNPAPKKSEEIPWDLFDRIFLPVVFSHAAAVIISIILNVLYISQVSSFTLLIFFLIISVGSTVFYHNLKVSSKIFFSCKITMNLRGGSLHYLDYRKSWENFIVFFQFVLFYLIFFVDYSIPFQYHTIPIPFLPFQLS